MEQRRKINRLKKSILFIFAFAILMIIGIGASSLVNASSQELMNDSAIVAVDSDTIVKVPTKEQLRIEIIEEIEDYVSSQTNNAHKFIPTYLANIGLENDIDICFIMAQTELETNFGTLGAGRAASRKSLFGVASKRYANYEDACNDYAQILKKSYLVNGKSEQHLMRNYVTRGGNRYAENPNYEAALRIKYDYIKSHTSIFNLQQEYNSVF